MKSIGNTSYARIILSAVLITLSFPPFDLWYVAFIALYPLIAELTNHPEKSFRKGILFGFVYSLFMVHWLAFNSGAAVWLVTISMVAAALTLSLNYGIIAWLATMVFRKNRYWGLAMFPLIWTSVEYLRTFGALGFPWVNLANSQSSHLLFIQTADIGSIYLLTFLIVTMNILVFGAIQALNQKNKVIPWFAGFFGILTVVYLYGFIALNRDYSTEKSVNFRILQPNYGSSEKWLRSNREDVFAVMDSLSRSPSDDSIQVIVWPESATPVYIRAHARYRNYLGKLANDENILLITGAPDYQRVLNETLPYNSLFLFEPTYGITVKYDKEHLVPFGEYIPMSEIWPLLKGLNLGQGNFIPGTNNPLFKNQAGTFTAAPMICYESIFPQPARRKVLAGGEFHILVTNDSWFGNSWGPYQHAAQAVFRAVETRRPVIRSANTGISFAVDIFGHRSEAIPLNRRGFLDQKLTTSSYRSFYVRYGDIFAQFVLIMAVISGFVVWRKK